MSQRPKRGSGSAARVCSLSPSGSHRARDSGKTLISSRDSDKSDDDKSDGGKTKGSDAIQALRSALDGLSQSELLSLVELARPLAQPTRADKSERLRAIVDDHLQHLLRAVFL